MKTLAEKWLASKQAQASIGALSPSRLASLRVHMAHVTAMLGENADAARIEEGSLEASYHFCLSKIAERHADAGEGWSTPYAKEVFTVARCFVRWLVERNVIDTPPRNLESRRFTFGAMSKKIETWTVEEVQRVIGEASGKLRLAMLLQLNCGMSQKDVSDLLDSEVNWREGRITRKRSKTRDREGTPTVCYRLWPETFTLLKEHRSEQARVLLTKSGKPFVYKRLVNGCFHAVDSFGDLYRRLQKRLDFRKPMKQLRKTSATILESHETYGRLTSLFLGHAPASLKDRHYADVPQRLFDEGVLWLGRQLGQV